VENQRASAQAMAELKLGGKLTSECIVYDAELWHLSRLRFNPIPLFSRYFADTVPELIYTFIEQNVRPGPLISLKCSASGSPPPQVSRAHSQMLYGPYYALL